MEIFISKPNLHKLSHLEDGTITQLTHCSHPSDVLAEAFRGEWKSTKMGNLSRII